MVYHSLENDLFDEDGTPKGEDQPQLLPDLLDQVEWMAVVMKAQRDKTGNVLNVEVSVGGRYINSSVNGFVKFTR